MLLFGVGLAACRCGPGSGEKPGGASTVTTGNTTPNTDAPTECPAALADTRRDGTRANSYVEPTDDERRAARVAMTALIKSGASGDLGAFGFEEVPLEGWPGTVLVREKGDKRRGGGAYVVRKGSTSTLLVEAPHTFYDEGTLPLACDLFQRTKARALFINTVHRYKASPGENGKHPSDVAHNPIALFQAMTEGVVDALPKLTVVQLHGFANHEVAAKAVVSSGEKKGGAPLVARAQSVLEAAIGGRVVKFPEDTNELGATTNVQGMAVRRAGGRFLHIEMDDVLRRDLNNDAALRAKALGALGALLLEP
jgi:hypothetical protein